MVALVALASLAMLSAIAGYFIFNRNGQRSGITHTVTYDAERLKLIGRFEGGKVVFWSLCWPSTINGTEPADGDVRLLIDDDAIAFSELNGRFFERWNGASDQGLDGRVIRSCEFLATRNTDAPPRIIMVSAVYADGKMESVVISVRGASREHIRSLINKAAVVRVRFGDEVLEMPVSKVDVDGLIGPPSSVKTEWDYP